MRKLSRLSDVLFHNRNMAWKWLFLCLLAALGALVWQSEKTRKELLRELGEARAYVNGLARHWEGWQLIFLSVGATLVAHWLLSWLFGEGEPLKQRIKNSVFSLLRKIPYVHNYVQKEMAKTRKYLLESVFAPTPGVKCRKKLPEKGLTHAQILEEIASMEKMVDIDWSKGWVSGAVYSGDPELTNLNTEVYRRFAWSNPLHTEVFPNVRKMEAEIIRWCVGLFNGGPDACGAVTSGGTESILMAMRSYRQLGYERGIKHPEIVCPVSTHAAFDKAADYFCMKLTHVPVDHLTRKVDLRAMARAISSNTVVLVGSTPQFPHGIIDPIEDIAKLAVKHGVGMHVDACLGGFILPFMARAGFPIEPFDFRVKGVTSISADTHKYGYCPKGTSVLMYSSKELRRRQYFMAPDWQGGMYGSPTMAGSRAGALVAATWATLIHMGLEGYVEATRKIVATTLELKAGINNIPGVYVLGDPKACVVSVGSKDFDIHLLSGAMTAKRWNLSVLQFPSSIHLSVTLLHTKEGVAKRLLSDMRECVGKIMLSPKAKPTGAAAMYGMSQSIPDRSLVKDFGTMFLDLCYEVVDSEKTQNSTT